MAEKHSLKNIWIITLFPEISRPYFEYGIAASAFNGSRGPEFKVHFISPASFSNKGAKGVDDSPYGGGPGMVMRADILEKTFLKGVVEAGNYSSDYKSQLKLIYPGPRGVVWNNTFCKEFANSHLSLESGYDLVFVCGRYEGIDQRFIDQYIDLEISVGNFILTGGELASLIILDSSIRFVDGVLGNKNSPNSESFENSLLEHSQYTRPRDFNGDIVPEVLLSGNHREIEKFRELESLEVTKNLRPDLYEGHLEN